MNVSRFMNLAAIFSLDLESQCMAYSPYKPTIGANIIKHLSLNILRLQCSMILAHIDDLVGAVGYTVGTPKCVL